MRTVEATASTREEAIQNALKELGVELHDTENVEILVEGSKGVFGIGAKNWKVRVTTQESPSTGGEERAPARGGEERAPGRGGEQRASARGGEDDERPPRRKGRTRSKRRPRGAGAARGAAPEANTARKQNAARLDPANEPEPEEWRNDTSEEQEDRFEEEPVILEPIDEADMAVLEERGKRAAVLLNEIIDKMGIESKVESVVNAEGGIVLNVESEDSAILIGRKGRTLSAIQYLINRIVDHEDESPSGDRIVVDVEGYLERRRESLEDMALDLAQRAKDTGRNIRVKPLSAQERRIVHLTLQEDPEIKTYSTGEGAYRTVIISPKNASNRRNDRGRGRGGRGGRGGGRQRDYQSEQRNYGVYQGD